MIRKRRPPSVLRESLSKRGSIHEAALAPFARIVLPRSRLPQLITVAGPDASRRFVEFFTANIRNRNTRAAYARAVGQFCAWCEKKRFTLELLEPVVIAAYVEELGLRLSRPSVKQHLAAIRMLFDYLVIGRSSR